MILYHHKNRKISVVHAGWKGAVDQIALEAYSEVVGNNSDKVDVIIGPSALACCYEVQKDFLSHFSQEMIEKCFEMRDGKIYYNNSLFVQLQLKNLGILERNIYTNYNICTICSDQYCSYRREKKSSRRNVTVAFLR